MSNKNELNKLLIKNPKLLKLLLNSLKYCKKAEKEINVTFKDLNYYQNLDFKFKNMSTLDYFQNNFFSLLFLSIFKSIGINKDDIIIQSKIIYFLRGIITYTDNIIDDDNKGLVLFDNTVNDSILENVLLIMTFQSFLDNTLYTLVDDKKTQNKIKSKILNEIFSIAKAEGKRKLDLYKEYPKSNFISDEIHSGIGGELLNLSFSTLEITEKSKTNIIDKAKQGVYLIGMSLQKLDDLTDIKEDIDKNQVNLAISRIIEYNNLDYKDFKKDTESLYEKYSEIIKIYVDETIASAMSGFKILEEINYPINENSSINLLKILFKLRGVEDLWKLSKYY